MHYTINEKYTYSGLTRVQLVHMCSLTGADCTGVLSVAAVVHSPGGMWTVKDVRLTPSTADLIQPDLHEVHIQLHDFRIAFIFFPTVY